MDAEEVQRRLTRTSPYFIKAGEKDEALSPLPFYRPTPRTMHDKEMIRLMFEAVDCDLAKDGL